MPCGRKTFKADRPNYGKIKPGLNQAIHIDLQEGASSALRGAV